MALSGAWYRGFSAAAGAALSSNGTQFGFKLGAALYAGSNLLSAGHNMWGKTTPHSVHSTYNGNVHAEIACLLKRRYYDKSNNLILYVYRATTDSQQTMSQNGCSRPCNNCMTAIKLAGVRRVRFFNESGEPDEIKL
jgi:tRNA(Arg) A34 adenosine deaminase TadA